MKCVMIIDDSLKPGIAANTAAALGISLAGTVEGLVGRELCDGSGRVHCGITNTPVPILATDSSALKSLYDGLLDKEDDGLRVIGFSDIAGRSHHYDDYEIRLKDTKKDEVGLLGVCIYGEKKEVNRLTGQLKMFR